MKRSKHNLSAYRLATCNMGELIPINCVPVLPGDTIQHVSSAMIRLSPLNTPVMHPTSVRIHHWFVPNRIVWDEWEDFITGGPDGTSTPTIPVVDLPTTKGDLMDHLYGAISDTSVTEVSELPLRAFNKIFNQRYRDQDIVTERAVDATTIPKIAWEKDYFGVARPWTQKGNDVTVPLGDRADIKGLGVLGANTGATNNVRETNASGTVNYAGSWFGNNVVVEEDPGLDYPDIYADLSGATGSNINDLRTAFSLQRYQEARARYGSRFTEYLRYLGIRPSDARLQEPEYLGGGTARVNFSEVLKTADDGGGGAQVGDMFGHGIAGARTNRFRKFFEEHGYVISVMSVRPKAIYLNGIPREYLKTTKEDFFQKELANLGQQEIYEAELFANGAASKTDVFGYGDRYEEYRRHPSQVCGDFRDTLNAWHMGRDLAANPTINTSFVECDPTDRIFQVGEATANTLWCFINHKTVARRIVPKRANPRIL